LAKRNRLSDRCTDQGSGDRTRRPLDGDLANGIVVDEFAAGRAGAEPGRSLGTPFDKSVSVALDRVDETTIRVTVKGPRNEFDFKVSSPGQVE